jgi:hypothetical protein
MNLSKYYIFKKLYNLIQVNIIKNIREKVDSEYEKNFDRFDSMYVFS